MSKRRDKTEEVDLDTQITEAMSRMSQAEKDLWIRVLFLLNQSERYTKFIEENFDISESIDEENKTINLRVEEKKQKPVQGVGLTLDTVKSMKIQLILRHNGVADTARVSESIIKILKGEDDEKTPGIVLASDADASKEIEYQKKLKGKLD